MMALLALAGCAIVYFSEPMSSAWLPKCPFKALTGLQCPACGSTRALHAMLHGHVLTGLEFNPMAPVLWGLAAVILMMCLRRRGAEASGPVRVLVGVYIAVYLAWGIIRNLL